jgi:hypothetical protein
MQLAEEDLYARMAGAESREGARQIVGAHRGSCTEPHRTDAEAHDLRDRATPFVDRCERRTRARQERLSRSRERSPGGPAIEQTRAHLALEPLDRRGQRRLGDVRVARRRREGAVLGNEREMPERLEHRVHIIQCYAMHHENRLD